jgi:type II secretory pathway pseudopilin PulG
LAIGESGMKIEAVPADRSLTLPRVAAALAAIVVLALVLPYGGVRWLHHRRLDAADERTRVIAEQLRTVLRGSASVIPPGTEVLAGPGDRPVVPAGQGGPASNDRWNSATSIPLARVLGGTMTVTSDPWGNAYLVNVAALETGGTVWVLSAGPDGIVQTPFLVPNGPLGDDRAAPVR